MALNKKQKKQIDVARKKLHRLRELRTAAKQQLDDPREVEQLEEHIAAVEADIERIKQG